MALLSKEQAAEYLGEKVTTLDNWRYTGCGPAYVKLPKAIKYTTADIDKWIAAQTVQPLILASQ